MTERATVVQKVQIGYETSAGTAATTFKEIRSLSIEPGVQMTRTPFHALGYRFDSFVPPGKEWTQANVRGPVTYGEVIYPLSMVFGTTTSAIAAQGTVTGGTAYKYVWAPTNNTIITPLTYTVEQGDGNFGQRITFGYMPEYGVSFNRDQIEGSGQLMAQRLTAITGTLTPGATSVELVPVLPEDVDVFIDTTSGSLGSTQQARVLSVDWRCANMHGPIWTLDSRNSSWAAPVNLSPNVEMRVRLEADSATNGGMNLLTDARNAARRYIRVKATGDAAGSVNYTFMIDFAGEISSVSPFSDDAGVYAIEYTFAATYDSTWGKTMEITVINHVVGF